MLVSKKTVQFYVAISSETAVTTLILEWGLPGPLAPIKATHRLRSVSTVSTPSLLIAPSLSPAVWFSLEKFLCELKKLKHLPQLIIKRKSKI